MKKIKLSYSAPAMHLEKQSPECSAQWGDCQFFINQEVEDCDVWVVFGGLEKPTESTICPPGNIIFITGEPSTIWHYDKKFLKQFSKIITCQREIKGSGVTYSLQGHPWHVGLNHANPNNLGLAKSYDELISLKEVPKTKLLSIIISNKQGTAGHRQRYKFALSLKKALGNQADLFGRGINDFNDKWDVLAPYKYSLAIENSAHNDYVTEKLFDCYLAHSFPFYYGAPNIDRYFSPDSYQLIDINNLDESVKVIKGIISKPNHYQEHLNFLKEAKLKYLNHYNIFPLIAELTSDWKMDQPKIKVILKNTKSIFFWDNHLRIVGDKLKTICHKIIE